MIHANAMGDFQGAIDARTRGDAICPSCNGRMATGSTLCVQCSNQNLTNKRWDRAGREADRRDRNRRYIAALEAGWSEDLLRATLCALPTWCEIGARDIGVLIRAWRRAE